MYIIDIAIMCLSSHHVQTFSCPYSLEVHAHTGDESVLRAVDSLLQLLMQRKNIDQSLTADLAYPTQPMS